MPELKGSHSLVSHHMSPWSKYYCFTYMNITHKVLRPSNESPKPHAVPKRSLMNSSAMQEPKAKNSVTKGRKSNKNKRVHKAITTNCHTYFGLCIHFILCHFFYGVFWCGCWSCCRCNTSGKWKTWLSLYFALVSGSICGHISQISPNTVKYIRIQIWLNISCTCFWVRNSGSANGFPIQQIGSLFPFAFQELSLQDIRMAFMSPHVAGKHYAFEQFAILFLPRH